MKNDKCTSLGQHSFIMGDLENGEQSICMHCGMPRSEALQTDRYSAVHTPFEVDQARNQQLDHLRANAKAHKKQIDRLTARLGQVTQQRDDAAAQLMVKEQEAAFYRAEFEQHCNVKRINVGGREGYMMREEIKPPTMVTVMTAWLISLSVTSGVVTAYVIAKLMGVL